MGCHEVDRLRGNLFRGHAKVTLVFAVFVIHKDNHTAAANFVNRLFNRRQWHGNSLYHLDLHRQMRRRQGLPAT